MKYNIIQKISLYFKKYSFIFMWNTLNQDESVLKRHSILPYCFLQEDLIDNVCINSDKYSQMMEMGVNSFTVTSLFYSQFTYFKYVSMRDLCKGKSHIPSLKEKFLIKSNSIFYVYLPIFHCCLLIKQTFPSHTVCRL